MVRIDSMVRGCVALFFMLFLGWATLVQLSPQDYPARNCDGVALKRLAVAEKMQVTRLAALAKIVEA